MADRRALPATALVAGLVLALLLALAIALVLALGGTSPGAGAPVADGDGPPPAAAPTASEAADDLPPTVLGARELVRVASADGEAVETLATVDTGAERSAISEEVADALDLDLDDADTVTVQSSLGEEERPLADIALVLAGETIAVTVSVTDRSELTDEVLIGRDVLDRFLVATADERRTHPDDAGEPADEPDDRIDDVPLDDDAVARIEDLLDALAADRDDG